MNEHIQRIAAKAGFRVAKSALNGRAYIPADRAKTKYDGCLFNHRPEDHNDLAPEVVALITLVAEECARICDHADKSMHPADLADAIRKAFKP